MASRHPHSFAYSRGSGGCVAGSRSTQATGFRSIQPFAHPAVVRFDPMVWSAEPAAQRLIVGANVIVEAATKAISLCNLRPGGDSCECKRQYDHGSKFRNLGRDFHLLPSSHSGIELTRKTPASARWRSSPITERVAPCWACRMRDDLRLTAPRIRNKRQHEGRSDSNKSHHDCLLTCYDATLIIKCSI